MTRRALIAESAIEALRLKCDDAGLSLVIKVDVAGETSFWINGTHAYDDLADATDHAQRRIDTAHAKASIARLAQEATTDYARFMEFHSLTHRGGVPEH